jgi:hypothetical protein
MNIAIRSESLKGMDLLGDLKRDENIIIDGPSRYLNILMEFKSSKTWPLNGRFEHCAESNDSLNIRTIASFLTVHNNGHLLEVTEFQKFLELFSFETSLHLAQTQSPVDLRIYASWLLSITRFQFVFPCFYHSLFSSIRYPSFFLPLSSLSEFYIGDRNICTRSDFGSVPLQRSSFSGKHEENICVYRKKIII